jgi:hypothetical protein
MRALVLMLLGGCAVYAPPLPDTQPVTGCEPDATAVVYSCGTGWAIVWPYQTMVCGELNGACAPDPTVGVATCDEGYVMSFPSEVGECHIDNSWSP